jgi:class 3 adenylate cyclase
LESKLPPDGPGSPAVSEPDQLAASKLVRKLVTILSADVAEYSRLMAEDEEQTLRLFREHSQTFQSLVDVHHGRIFNTAGDAILAEFTSPVEAVRCATDIQAALRTRNDQFPLSRQVRFRIGVNLGDVMVQNSDLLGDGVNVAARLQGAAAPGGICISGSVYDQIRNKLSLGFESLGERRFKNIPQPVRTFTVAGTNDEGQLPPSKTPSGRSGVLVSVAALSLLVLAGGYWAYSAYRQGQTGQFSAMPKSSGQVPVVAGPVPKIDAKNAAAPAAAKAAATPTAETQSPQAPSGSATASELSRLMRSEEVSSNKCTDGSGDLEETGRACAERDRLVEVLADRGWCYEKSWQRCAR